MRLRLAGIGMLLAWESWKRAFVLAVAVVAALTLALAVCSVGDGYWGDFSVRVIGLAAAGGLLGAWMKWGLTGRASHVSELAQDLLVTGALAASASSLAVLQTPATWSEVLRLSSPVAAITLLVYHLTNLQRLASSERHLRPTTALAMVATPFILGSLVVLESTSLVGQLGAGLTAGLLAAWPAVVDFAGRVLVVFGFNELVANGLALATRRTAARSLTLHLTLLLAAVAVIVAPAIAGLGSGSLAASAPPGLRALLMVGTTMLSQAGLWAEVYLITGLLLRALNGQTPASDAAAGYAWEGLKKGMIYSGVFMAILCGMDLLAQGPGVARLLAAQPTAVLIVALAVAFPLAKTILETFDGSQGFFRRVALSYRHPTLYLRGAVVGWGVGYALGHSFAAQATLSRVMFGAAVGVAAFAGVSLLRDVVLWLRRRGMAPCWRVYLLHLLLGGLIGAGLGFYLDGVQVSRIVAKFHRYLSVGQTPELLDVYPLLSKWGYLRLTSVSGGVSLLWGEALMGVISWSIPAWLFALNRTFLSAYFRRETAPIRALVTREGLRQLAQNMIEVLRWGLWMSPIIASFLRPMAEPTWYNQDGAIHTVMAVVHQTTSTPEAFRVWSLGTFIALLAYDWVRIAIWLDHMGLRVATLVNLSFLGMDRLDQRLARFLGPAATAQCIPEAVKRFATWAPLLIPFYLPMGADWDRAWSESESLRAASVSPLARLAATPLVQQLLLAAAGVAVGTCTFALFGWWRRRVAVGRQRVWSISNGQYEVVLKERGEIHSQVLTNGYDVSRRSYDLLDPAGRALFVIDRSEESEPSVPWRLLGESPRGTSERLAVEPTDAGLRLESTRGTLHARVEIALAGHDAAEVWTITLENRGPRERSLKLVPYLEWVLNRPQADRGHTQYNRLYPEMEFTAEPSAVLAWHKQSKALGLLAADVPAEGFLTSRVDFLGRARSLASPRVLETLDFEPPEPTGAHPTFDPIGSLLLDVRLKPHESKQVRLLIGLVEKRSEALELIARHLHMTAAAPEMPPTAERTLGHGEIPPGTPQPYASFLGDGRTLRVHTPFTPRPYDHTMSNALGHVMVVTNRGLHTSSNGNSQQNRLTPDWPDTATREVPGEAFYLYDLDDGQWYSPTYHPLNDAEAHYEVDFSVDGTATYRMQRGPLATELVAFVPPGDPVGVYQLTVRNRSDVTRQIRLAPYFQMVLAEQPESVGSLRVRRDARTSAVYFENPRNAFRTGPAFVAMSAVAEQMETCRGRFFGDARDVARPYLVERGTPDRRPTEDQRPVAALLTTLEIPPQAERTVTVVLGQADSRRQARTLVRKYRDHQAVQAAQRATRRWWQQLLDRVQVRGGATEMNRLLDWLKYQTLAERIWARRGFYQASGAFGFRDQLQDAVNLIWLDPSLARQQILLHASQQFLEGDVVHWFHRLQDGRTGMAARTYASDNLLWLAWATVEYVEATGDLTLLDEQAGYLEAQQPLAPLPAGKHGMGFIPLRSSRSDTVYAHVMRAIDLVLERRMGRHGLPLIGTGDWNDGLDEIGSQGRGESVWLGLFLYGILRRIAPMIERREGEVRASAYRVAALQLEHALQETWRGDRYLRAIHDDGTEIGLAGSGVWEIDALTAAWAVMSGLDPERGRTVFDTALAILERENVILLGWPALSEDTRPYLGRSSWYPPGVRENGMYCHGVQWLIGAARLLAEQCQRQGDMEAAQRYAETAWRLWRKTSPLGHVTPGEIETYGGQPNKQAADLVTGSAPGRMGWHGYTGAAGWLWRQALEGVLGLRLEAGRVLAPAVAPPAPLNSARVSRQLPHPAQKGGPRGDAQHASALTRPERHGMPVETET